MSTSSSSPDNICANCGKGEESSEDLKACTACKMVNYCNRDYQIAHRLQHKKACKKKNGPLSYMMTLYSKILIRVRIVQFACYPYQLIRENHHFIHAAGNISVMAACMP